MPTATLDPDASYYAMPGSAAGAMPSPVAPGVDAGGLLQLLQAAGLVPSQTAANLAVDMTTPAPAPAPVAAPGPGGLAALQAMLGNGLTSPAPNPQSSNSQSSNSGGTIQPPPVTPGGLPALQALLNGGGAGNQTSGNQPPAGSVFGSAPQLSPNPYTPDQAQAPTPPTLPDRNNNVLKGLAALSAIMGGQGGIAGANALARQQESDQQQFQARSEAYNQQVRSQQEKTAQAQGQASMQSQLVSQLARLDDGSQQQAVTALLNSPQQLAAYGLTPDQVRSEFYDAQGNFQPVAAADKASDDVALQRVQNQARALLYQMTPAAQQSLYDSYAGQSDQWEQEYGVPYDQFTPGERQADATRQQNADTNAKKTDAQVALDSANAALAKAKIGGVASEIKARQADVAVAQQRVALEAQRNTETARHDQVTEGETTRRDTLTHTDRVSDQVLRAQNSAASQKMRQSEFSMRYGPQAPDKLKQYNSILKQRSALATQLGKMEKPDPNDLSDNPLAPKDTPEGKGRYQMLLNQDRQLNQEQYSLMNGGTSGLPPATVTPRGHGFVSVTDGAGHLHRVPSVPVLPPLAPGQAVYRDRAGNPTAIGPASGVGSATMLSPGLRALGYKGAGRASPNSGPPQPPAPLAQMSIPQLRAYQQQVKAWKQQATQGGR